MRRHILTLLILLMGAPSLAAEAPIRSVPGSFIIKLSPTADRQRLTNSLAVGQELTPITRTISDRFLPGMDVWNRYQRFTSRDTTLTNSDVVAILGARNVELIEPEVYLEFFDLPAEPLFDNQWYLRNTGQPYLAIERLPGSGNDIQTTKSGVAAMDVGMTQIYGPSPPAEATRVVVAVIDSGVDTDHPELAGQFWHNIDEIAGNGVDDDHNGFIDDTIGYDVSGDVRSLFAPEGDNNPDDDFGHGTHIAGIIAARQDNAGVVGIAPSAQIMPLKIRPNGTSAIGAAAIIYAVVNGAKIINASWGTPFQAAILQDALTVARANDVLFVAAAGNSGDNQRWYPGAYPESFTVAATNSRGTLTYFTTRGEPIDISAPGEDILSIRAGGTDMYETAGEPGVRIVDPDSLYYLSDGTSMAAPMVCAAAAIIWSVRPDLTVDQVRQVLIASAEDIIDPLEDGSQLFGPDTLSGAGVVNIDNALDLISRDGMFISAPVLRQRYEDSLHIDGTALGSFAGSWSLDYRWTQPNASDWMSLTSGATPPNDYRLASLAATRSGIVELRLSAAGQHSIVPVALIGSRQARITSPQPGEYAYGIPITVEAYGQSYDSAVVTIRQPDGSRERLTGSTAEYFDSLFTVWEASGIDTGQAEIELRTYYADGLVLADTVSIALISVFAEGWPNKITGRGGLTPVATDVDGDGRKELFVASSQGVHGYRHTGQPLSGWPVQPVLDFTGIPAAYDIDRDSEKEIVVAERNGIWAFNLDGTIVDGWPVSAPTGFTSFGYPVVSVVELGSPADSALAFLSTAGDVYAYRFDGTPYFFSLDGFFAGYPDADDRSYNYAGNAVASADLDGNGTQELIAAFSGLGDPSGIAIFDGRTGQAAFGPSNPVVLTMGVVNGMTLADFTGDGQLEYVVVGALANGDKMIDVRTNGIDRFGSWPVMLPDANGYRGAYPTAADLDLDGVPEVIVTFFEFDIASVYAFRADGSPYRSRPGRPVGELAEVPATLGSPVVANLTGDDYPEIIIRSGYLFPSTGPEQIHVFDFEGTPLPGWPIRTPARPNEVFSTIYSPLVDDIDADGLVELVLMSEGADLLVWDFDASSGDGNNYGRVFGDEMNSSRMPTRRIPTDVPDTDPQLPTTFRLEQNYPNPFNPTTSIVFDLPQRANVQLEVFNLLGQRVATLVNGERGAGRYTVRFDGAALASGVYFYRLNAGETTLSRKMLLLK